MLSDQSHVSCDEKMICPLQTYLGVFFFSNKKFLQGVTYEMMEKVIVKVLQ